jgi:hypothetical protein
MSELEAKLDKLWEEWKFMNHLPESSESYLAQMWFFYYIKKCLCEENKK